MNAKSSTVAYLLWLISCHYLYFRRPGVQLLYWLTLGGLGIWSLIDLFRIPAIVDEHNEANGFATPPSQPVRSRSGDNAFAVVVLLLLAAAWVKREAIRDVFFPRATASQSAAPRATADAQARAVRLYPELGRPGSPLNAEFLRRYEQHRSGDLSFFTDPDWPTRLAQESAPFVPVPVASAPLLPAAAAAPARTPEPESYGTRRELRYYGRPGYGGHYEEREVSGPPVSSMRRIGGG